MGPASKVGGPGDIGQGEDGERCVGDGVPMMSTPTEVPLLHQEVRIGCSCGGLEGEATWARMGGCSQAVSGVRNENPISKYLLSAHYVPGALLLLDWQDSGQGGKLFLEPWLLSGTEDREGPALGCCSKWTPHISGLPRWLGICQGRQAKGETGPGQTTHPPCPL